MKTKKPLMTTPKPGRSDDCGLGQIMRNDPIGQGPEIPLMFPEYAFYLK